MHTHAVALRGAPRREVRLNPSVDAARPVDPRTASRVRRAQGGDRTAFGELYEAYAPAVHGVLLSQIPAAEAQDLVHDVFVAALSALGELEDPERFGPWLLTIARNRGRDLLRGRARHNETLAEEPLAPGEPRALDEAEEAAQALAALRSLPEAYREPLILRLVEGLSGREIARRMGLTYGSVRVNLCRGRRLLRERLGVGAEGGGA